MPRRVLGVKLLGGRDQFLDVGQAFLIVFVVAGLEHVAVAGAFDDLADDSHRGGESSSLRRSSISLAKLAQPGWPPCP